MPTPATQQPSGEVSPVSHAFPTCPDEQPHASRSSRQTLESSMQEEAFMAVRPDTYNGESSIEPFSRSATTSPGPVAQRGNAGLKRHEEDPNIPLTRESSIESATLSVGSSSPSPHMYDSMDFSTEEEDGYETSSSGSDYYTSPRTIPISPSSYLRPGSKFRGTQQSERQVYEVQVEIKHVDMRESFLCGYLRIQGLTEDHPTLTTYFEGEIIGSKYGFITEHEDWGATQKVDLNHWGQFSAFRQYHKLAKKGRVTIHDVAQKECIFMRWKEHFLVPDHRVRTITGASFEGFYYICFNQLKGEVSGIYFHSKSEKFQQLELKHVPDRGCFAAMEFR